MSFCKPPAEDRRHARRQATRESILAAGESLVLEQGYDGLKTKDLVDRAGVSERTVFNHFENLEAVLLARIDDYLTPLVLEPPFPEGLAVQDLPDAVEHRFRTCLDDPEGRLLFEKFLRLAAALVQGKGDVLARQVALNLLDIAGRLVKDIEARYSLTTDQSISLRLFVTHLVFALALGVLRGADTLDLSMENLSLPETVPPVEELMPHVRWAFDQVVAGKPRF